MDTFSGMISKEEFDAKDFSLRKRLELKNSKENNMWLPLSLMKDDNEGGEFYFLGDLEVDKNSLSETFIEDKKNVTMARVSMIRCCAFVIASGLDIMGVRPEEEMR